MAVSLLYRAALKHAAGELGLGSGERTSLFLPLPVHRKAPSLPQTDCAAVTEHRWSVLISVVQEVAVFSTCVAKFG